MMPWCHGWGCSPPLTASHIHGGHILSVFLPSYEVCRHMSAPLPTVTLPMLGLILAILGNCQVKMMPWCYGWGCRPLQNASHIHSGYIKSVLASFNEARRHMSAPYTITTQLKLGQILAILGDSWVEIRPWCNGWGCSPPLITSHLHFGHI